MQNKHRYSLFRLVNLLLGIPLTVVALFITRKPLIVLTSALNQTYNDNSRALFEALYGLPAFKDRVYFVHNNKYKREQLNKIYPGCFISNRSWRGLCIILSAKYWCSSTLELPAPGFLNRHLRTVYHLGHGMLYKNVGLSEVSVNWYKKLYYKLIFTNISYTWCTTSFFMAEITSAFGVSKSRVMVLPQPKTGDIARPIIAKEAEFKGTDNLHVLYAPTWRPYADTRLFPFADVDLDRLNNKLQQLNVYIWLRMHPRFIERLGFDLMQHSNIKIFYPNKYSEINRYLHLFNALITDYSSIYFDYLRLHRPVWFFDYDIDKYQEHIGLIKDYKQIKSRESTTSQSQFEAQLADFTNGAISVSKERAIDAMVNYDVENKAIANLLIQRLF